MLVFTGEDLKALYLEKKEAIKLVNNEIDL
jgi:hypothetical protein